MPNVDLKLIFGKYKFPKNGQDYLLGKNNIAVKVSFNKWILFLDELLSNDISEEDNLIYKITELLLFNENTEALLYVFSKINNDEIIALIKKFKNTEYQYSLLTNILTYDYYYFETIAKELTTRVSNEDFPKCISLIKDEDFVSESIVERIDLWFDEYIKNNDIKEIFLDYLEEGLNHEYFDKICHQISQKLPKKDYENFPKTFLKNLNITNKEFYERLIIFSIKLDIHNTLEEIGIDLMIQIITKINNKYCDNFLKELSKHTNDSSTQMLIENYFTNKKK